VPAHFWVPDVTAGTPIAVAAYVTTIPKVAALVALARLVSLLPPEAVNWPLAIALLAALSMTLGNLAAFWQETPRRLFAYSTIAQIGYLLMAVTVLGRSELALPGLLFFAAAYAAMNFGLSPWSPKYCRPSASTDIPDSPGTTPPSPCSDALPPVAHRYPAARRLRRQACPRSSNSWESQTATGPVSMPALASCGVWRASAEAIA